MYVGNDYPDMSPTEVRRLTLDFVNDVNISAGETLVSAIWSCEVPIELNVLTDPLPASHLQTMMVSGTQVIQTVSGLLPGIVYRMRCIGTTNAGSQPELFTHVRCVLPV